MTNPLQESVSGMTGKIAIVREYSEYYTPEIHRAGEMVFIGNKDVLSSLFYCTFLDGTKRPYVPDELNIIRDDNLQWWLMAQFDKIVIEASLNAQSVGEDE